MNLSWVTNDRRHRHLDGRKCFFVIIIRFSLEMRTHLGVASPVFFPTN